MKLLEIDPTFSDRPYYILADFYYQLGELETAETLARNCLSLNPQSLQGKALLEEINQSKNSKK